jgi:hypothetical protein
VAAFEVGGVKAPQLPDAVAGDTTAPCKALKGLRVNAKDSGGLIAIQERFRNELEFGHGSYAS